MAIKKGTNFRRDLDDAKRIAREIKLLMHLSSHQVRPPGYSGYARRSVARRADCRHAPALVHATTTAWAMYYALAHSRRHACSGMAATEAMWLLKFPNTTCSASRRRWFTFKCVHRSVTVPHAIATCSEGNMPSFSSSQADPSTRNHRLVPYTQQDHEPSPEAGRV